MSGYETRDMTGKLFKNERKAKESQPDYTGECVIDGQAHYMDAWLKTSDTGRRWMSFSFKPKAGPQQAVQPQSARARPAPPKSGLPPGRAESSGPYAPVENDDIPF